MNFRENPVIILAAGKGNRMENNFKLLNKALIPIYGNHTIIDILLFELITQGISDILIIAGYRIKLLKEYFRNLKKNIKTKPLLDKISEEFKKTNIQIVKAQKDFQIGPLYTLTTLNKYFFGNKSQPSKKLRFKKDDYLTVIPSDTLFDLNLLEIIFLKNPTIDPQLNGNFCHLFYLRLLPSSFDQLKKEFLFEGAKIKENPKVSIKLDNKTSPNNEIRNFITIQIPIVIITKDFISFAEKIQSKDVNTLQKALDQYYRETGRIYKNNLDFNINEFPPFMDIDTKKVYDKTVKIVTSLITEKK